MIGPYRAVYHLKAMQGGRVHAKLSDASFLNDAPLYTLLRNSVFTTALRSLFHLD